MFRVICKSIYSFGRNSVPHQLLIPKLQEFSSSAEKSISKDSFTVQYLINEFGFSLQKAVLACKYKRFQNRDKPDAVVSLLKHQGFSDAQIRKLISVGVAILYLKPEKTLLPKFEFLRSKGISETDLVKMIMFHPKLLQRSLKHHILPSYEFFRAFLGSDESVICMLKRNARLLSAVQSLVKPKIEVLSQAGVSHSSIAYLLKNQPPLFFRSDDKVKESVDKVHKLGMDPRSCIYNLALSFLTMSRSKWSEKLEVYERWGCSEDEVMTSFKILPWIITLSAKKINDVMSFCVKEMGWKPSEVLRTHFLLTLSLNKRIKPRWSVYQELVSKRLVKKTSKLRTLFKMNDDLFLEKYVKCYLDESPVLSKLYLENWKASK